MGSKIFTGSTNDNFKAYKEGGFLGLFKEWRNWYIDGAGGNDTLIGGAKNDTILGGAGNDSLQGLDGADSIVGGAGTDTLYGGSTGSYSSAIDTLIGGSDSDTYHADTSDLIVEEASGGLSDAIYLTKDWSRNGDYFMPANVETLYLEGQHTDRIFGNSLSNTIIVNGANYNVVDGGGGRDYLRAGSQGGGTLRGGADNDTLDGGVGGNNLLGDSGDDLLNGVGFGSGSTGVGTVDTLTGGTGADRFWLGNALKTYYADGDINTSGTNDYALITDFQAGIDKLVINSYSYAYIVSQAFMTGVGASDAKETLIYRDNGTRTPDLIAVLQDQTPTLYPSDFLSA